MTFRRPSSPDTMTFPIVLVTIVAIVLSLTQILP